MRETVFCTCKCVGDLDNHGLKHSIRKTLVKSLPHTSLEILSGDEDALFPQSETQMTSMINNFVLAILML